MIYYFTKVVITAVLVVLISEIAKRSSLVGAIVASVPLTSVLAMVWLYVDTGETDRVSNLASSVFWLVLPSLVLFIALPLLLEKGLNFYLSLGFSIGITVACYWVMVMMLRHFGVEL